LAVTVAREVGEIMVRRASPEATKVLVSPPITQDRQELQDE